MQTPESTGAGVWTWGPAPVADGDKSAYWGIWSPDGQLIGTTSRHERALRTVCRLNRDQAITVLHWLGEQGVEMCSTRCLDWLPRSSDCGRPSMKPTEPMQSAASNADEFILGDLLTMHRLPRQETAVLAVYLTVADCKKLDRIASVAGKTLAEVIQDAIRAYQPAGVGQGEEHPS